MSKVYLPTFTTNNCIVVLDKDTIRVYDQLPVADSTQSYTDYFVNSHYLSKNGLEYINSVPSCADQEDFTTDYFYRFDFHYILTSVFIISIVCIYFPFKLLSRMFGRWLKL